MIDRLLHLYEVSNYVCCVHLVFLKSRPIAIKYDNNTIQTDLLNLFVSKNNISRFLGRINNIKYNSYIETYPEFQYIQIMICKLKNIFIELLSLHEKNKFLLLKSDNSINNQVSYNSFLTALINPNIILNLKDYTNLDVNVMYFLQKLKEKSDYAINMFNLLQNSFSCYSLYYATKTLPTHNISQINLKNNIINTLFTTNLMLDKYWTDYINTTKLSVFLQVLIKDADNLIVKSNLNKNIQEVNNLTNTITVLSLLIQYYDEYDISHNLIIVSDYSKIQLFLSAMLYHYS